MAVSQVSLVRPFYPALDGLRAIAILMVFAFHASPFLSFSSVTAWGWVGVDLFFVLSGFLITGILYDALHKPRFFRDFYIRRSLRIFPLFYGFWLALIVVSLFLHPFVKIGWNRYLLASGMYLGNLFVHGAMLGWHPDPFALSVISTSHPEPRYIVLGHLWTLCVEEQFYLIWPLLVWLVRSRRVLLTFCLTVIFIAPFFRWFLYLHLVPALSGGGFLYCSTFTRVDTLLVGAALALWMRGPALHLRTIRWACVGLCVVPLSLLVLCMVSRLNRWPINLLNPILNTIGFTLIAFIAAGILLATINPSSPLGRILNVRPLIATGRLSYGIYILHEFPLQIVGGHSLGLARHHLSFIIATLAFAWAYGLAWLSFRYFESPFLRLKDRFAPHASHASDPPPVGTTPFPTAPVFDLVRPTA